MLPLKSRVFAVMAIPAVSRMMDISRMAAGGLWAHLAKQRVEPCLTSR
jgi:hypothetical protein